MGGGRSGFGGFARCRFGYAKSSRIRNLTCGKASTHAIVQMKRARADAGVPGI
jgi:hypothetical protein